MMKALICRSAALRTLIFCPRVTFDCCTSARLQSCLSQLRDDSAHFAPYVSREFEPSFDCTYYRSTSEELSVSRRSR